MSPTTDFSSHNGSIAVYVVSLAISFDLSLFSNYADYLLISFGPRIILCFIASF